MVDCFPLQLSCTIMLLQAPVPQPATSAAQSVSEVDDIIVSSLPSCSACHSLPSILVSYISFHESSHCHLLSSAIICYHLLSSAVICCHVLSCAVICCHVLSSTVICCHLLSSAVICYHLLSSAVICHHLLSSAAICYHMLSSAVICHHMLSSAVQHRQWQLQNYQ